MHLPYHLCILPKGFMDLFILPWFFVIRSVAKSAQLHRLWLSHLVPHQSKTLNSTTVRTGTLCVNGCGACELAF